MKLSELTETDKREHLVYVIFGNNVYPGVVHNKSAFGDKDYEFTFQGDISGILHIKEEEMFRTKEEASRELFKQKLAGKRKNPATHGEMQPPWTVDKIK